MVDQAEAEEEEEDCSMMIIIMVAIHHEAVSMAIAIDRIIRDVDHTMVVSISTTIAWTDLHQPLGLQQDLTINTRGTKSA